MGAEEYLVVAPTDLDPVKVAEEILRTGRNELFVKLRFLSQSIHMLTPVPLPTIPLPVATDGKSLFFQPEQVMRKYVADRSWGSSAWLHMILHCMFGHCFFTTLLDVDCWNLACDIAVAAAAEEFGLDNIACTPAMKQELRKLRAHHTSFAAHRLYEDLLDTSHSPEERNRLADVFCLDDHSTWYIQDKVKEEGEGDGQGDGQGDGITVQIGGSATGNKEPEGISLAEAWKKLAEQVQTDLETFSKRFGSQAGSMMQSLRAVTREKHDYADFLRKFATMHEAMRVDTDSFDYIFYTYGLEQYGDMPLIEPLEYKDVPLVKEFVIAIDTSGSTSGELVQTFLQKTYNILKSTESFTTRVNIRILQCDAQIQSDERITCDSDLERYIEDLSVSGLGGTDFRPVFSYVDQLIANREFRNLKGLIYFTDGYGEFPAHASPHKYKTAFVFIDDEDNNYDVPPWAISLVLRKDEI